jgi:hypothetical protein
MWKHFMIALILLSVISFAHLGEEVEEHNLTEIKEECGDSCFMEESIDYNMLAAEAGLGLLILIAAISIVFRKKLKKAHKKFMFILMLAIIISVTSFLAFTTIYANYFSASGGPVHWHADYEVWVCGERMQMQESEGLENKVGTPVFHHHNDNRIHVEGIVMRMEDIALGRFFEIIGGHLDNESLKIVLLDDSVKEARNGDLCNGTPGRLRMFVDGKENFDFDRFILAPYSTVPPGNFINITFGAE